MRRWAVEWFDVFDWLASGELQPYSPITGKKIKWLDFDRQNHVEAYDKKESFKMYLFLKEDIDAFKQRHGLAQPVVNAKPLPQQSPLITKNTEPVTEKKETIKKKALADADEFIRNLKVAYNNNSSVILTPEGKKPNEYSCSQMGFKETAKTWTMFIDVLKKDEPQYHVGIYSNDKNPIKNRNYNSALKILKEFSK